MNPRVILVGGLGFIGLGVIGFVLPRWTVFLLSLALARGLAALSVALLMRAGLVSFGQSLFFATGAYGAAFLIRLFGVREAVVLLVGAVVASMALAALAGLWIARYREIFFAMLSLAFTMILYGWLLKAYWITGGTDGMRIPPPTVLGVVWPIDRLRTVLYLVTLGCTALALGLTHLFLEAPLGYAVRAVRDNEIRLEYLGSSVGQVVYWTYVLAAGLAGLGGVLMALNVGHVDPQLAYWTTAGEFVFIALLGGTESALAPFLGAVLFEFFRTYALKYAPYTWQMALGGMMLLLVLFMPRGLWTLRHLRFRKAVP
jgi:branched-chain amino acid transport system permease protein